MVVRDAGVHRPQHWLLSYSYDLKMQSVWLYSQSCGWKAAAHLLGLQWSLCDPVQGLEPVRWHKSLSLSLASRLSPPLCGWIETKCNKHDQREAERLFKMTYLTHPYDPYTLTIQTWEFRAMYVAKHHLSTKCWKGDDLYMSE